MDDLISNNNEVKKNEMELVINEKFYGNDKEYFSYFNQYKLKIPQVILQKTVYDYKYFKKTIKFECY